MKTCARCNKKRKISDYGILSKSPDGRRNVCKFCRINEHKTRYIPSPIPEQEYEKGEFYTVIKAKRDGIFLSVLIDNEDLDKISSYRWWVNKRGYVITEIKKKPLILHRFITNCPDDMVVDHINHDKLDNRKNNLRICSQKQNNQNVKKTSRPKTSKYKGVFRPKNQKKWISKIKSNGKIIMIGYFDNERLAAEAYNKKALELFGEFSCLNIIEEDQK